MHTFTRWVGLWSLILALALAAVLPLAISAAAPGQAPAPLTPEVQSALEAGLQQAVLARQEKSLAFVLYRVVVDRAELSADGKQALLWLALAERDSEHVQATEPGLAIAALTGTDPADPAAWSFCLQVDEDWAGQLEKLAPELITPDQRESFMRAPAGEEPHQSIEAIGGYHLPWANGRSKLLEGSIAHFKIYFSCRYDSDCYYAYDFADGTMFPLVAARAGTVYTYYDGCANGNHACSNYIVLKDTSTNPVTYQLYLHIAYRSVPSWLRTVGAQVKQGEYIANVDDTGYSTGHHLHFHVFTYFTTSYWGPSVDITFNEVTVNDGRPRTCEEADRWPSYGDECIPGDWYVSANAVPYPPSGAMTAPQPFERVTQPNLTVSGWATDREGIAAITIQGRWDGTWHTLAQPAQAGFSTVLDLCALGVPNGPLDLALTIEDKEGNRLQEVGRRSVLLNLSCPALQTVQPACQPASDQVAIYSDANYRGSCVRLNVGQYNSPGEFPEIGNNNVESVQVGAEVRALLFHNGYFGGRTESLEADDPNLADNPTQANTLSSIKVVDRTILPSAPLINPPNADSVTSVVFSWSSPGALDTEAQLFGPDDPDLLAAQRDYAPGSGWSVGSLAAGEYVLRVTARNSAGTDAEQVSFNIRAASLPAQSAQSLPYTADFSGSGALWLASGGWQWTEDAWAFAGALAGDLTSPPIHLPAAPASALRFRFYADTEDDAAFWDQMRVQVAPQGGNFSDLWQITDQAQTAWLESPALDLSAYAGQTVRLRFHFDALDANFNNAVPWRVDDVRVQAAVAPLACAETTRNDTWQTATSITDTKTGAICPSGDVDFYAFNAPAGGHLGLSFSGGFAPIVGLYDASGGLLLEGAAPLRMVLPRTGTYYAKVRAADHPGAGGEGFAYTLTKEVDITPPSVNFLCPTGTAIPGTAFTLSAQAVDNSGVQSVSLYAHSGTWPSDWQLLGVDANPADGWSWQVDPAALGGLADGGLALRALDAAGNSGADWRVNLSLGLLPPAAVLEPLASPYPGTMVSLNWGLTDICKQVDHFDLQYRSGAAGAWQTLDSSLPLPVRQAWFMGAFGQSYAFRLRTVDLAGNASTYASTSTVIETACTPDDYEDGDDQPAGARPLDADGLTANLCAAGDADYYQVNGVPGQTLLALAQSVSGGAAVTLELWQAGDLLAASASSGPGAAASIRWQAQNAEPYLVRVTPLAGVAGSQVVYRVMAFVPVDVFLPVIRQ